jgi:hypothetical protein
VDARRQQLGRAGHRRAATAASAWRYWSASSKATPTSRW